MKWAGRTRLSGAGSRRNAAPSRSVLLKALYRCCQDILALKNFHGTREQARGWPFLGLCASFPALHGEISLHCPSIVQTAPSQGAAMNQIIDWMQNNWYELGSLLAQFTFLFAGLWFAGKILRAMRTTQQQMGALLRLSMTDGLQESSKISESARETLGEGAHEPT